MCKGNAICNSQLWTQMGNHATDLMLLGSEVKASVSALCEPVFLALKLSEQSVQGDPSGCEDAKVPMHG